MRKYIIPEIKIIVFETEETITASGDFEGVNFEELI